MIKNRKGVGYGNRFKKKKSGRRIFQVSPVEFVNHNAIKAINIY